MLELTLSYAHSLYYLGRFPESAKALLDEHSRLENVKDPTLAGPYFFWMAHMHSRLGTPESAVRFARRAVAEGQQCGDVATEGKAYTVLTLEGFWSGNSTRGIQDGLQAIQLLEGTSELYWLGMAYCFLGFNYMLSGNFKQALEAEAQTQKIGKSIAEPRIQTYATFSIGWFSAMMGDWDKAIHVCLESLRGAPDPASTAYASAFLGYAYLEQGDAMRALPLLDEAVKNFAKFHFPQFEGWFTALLAEAHRCTQQFKTALVFAERSLDIVGSVPYFLGIAWAQRSLGRIAWAAESHVEAETFLTQALETFSDMPMPFEMGRTRLDLAALDHARNKQDSARDHLKEAHTNFTRLQVSMYVERTLELAKEYGITL